ncbi:MAG: hypothetical protein ACI4SF_05975 [Oscillospiraceae bacterium]
MSMLLHLIFDTKEKLDYVIKKYNWTESQYELVRDDFLSNYCVCAYYGNGSYTDGIGEYDILSYSIMGSQMYLLNDLVSRIDQRKSTELTTTYYSVVETLNNVVKWSNFVKDNIALLEHIGFLLNRDAEGNSFSNVVFAKKEYYRLELIDFLTVQEDVVLWITMD